MLFFDSLRYISVVYIDLVEDLRKVGGFLRVIRFPPSIKLIATM
jgi:hypothetical protein